MMDKELRAPRSSLTPDERQRIERYKDYIKEFPGSSEAARTRSLLAIIDRLEMGT